MSNHKITFIIPTKDRPEKLRNLLISLEKQNSKELLETIIVDSGQQSDKQIASEFPGLKIRYIKVSKPSLTAQRNIGINSINKDSTLVGFFDDDIELEKGSLKHMLDFWDNASLAVGGAGFNLNDKKSQLLLIKQIFNTGHKKLGIMLPSGFGSKICPVEKNVSTEWVYGGATIWRRKIIEEFKFDEWFEGYGLAEDLDFSYRVGKEYKLVAVADSKVKHLQSELSEINNFKFGKMEVLGHYYIIKKFSELSSVCFFWACFGIFLENLSMTILKQRREFLQRAMGNLSGVLQALTYKIPNKKRILVIGYKSPPYGGMETITDLIVTSDYLNEKLDLTSLMLYTRQASENRGSFSIHNIVMALVNFLRFLYLLIKYNPELVYTHLAQNKAGFLRDSVFIICSKLFNKRNCVHFHGSAFKYFYETQSTIMKAYIKFTFRKIDTLIVLGETLRKQFYELIDESKIIHIYNAIKIDNYTAKTKDTNLSNALRIVFLGYISKAKGALDVVKAASLILSKNNKIPVYFDLYGPTIDIEKNISFINDPDGASQKISELILQNNLSEFIRVHSVIDNYQVREILANADIFIHPSYSEGCSLVVLEAMASSLPIVMTNVGSLPEVLNEKTNCFFINPGDYQSLAEKILILSNEHSLRIEMGANNRKLVETFFNSSRFEQDLINIWNNI
ncbi:MAG: glycosyltransferase [bacterium]